MNPKYRRNVKSDPSSGRIMTGTPVVRRLPLGANRMQSPPARIRAALRFLIVVMLAVFLAGFPAGCELLKLDREPEPVARSVDATEAPAPSPATLPGKHATRRGCYVFYHDFDLDPNDPLFEPLEGLPDQVYGELKLPPANTIIQVFLFDTQERYERYMFSPRNGRYRHLPSRRAYFITEPRSGGGADELKVFTWMGDHLRVDLRHELTHALLNAVLKSVPLWLDEGLAGYFELPPDHEGVNPQHLDSLRRGVIQPDLDRLEKLEQVKQMEKPEYREAWAWVHFMLRGNPAARKVLLDYLQALRSSSPPTPLLPRLREVIPDPEHSLAAHLERIEFPRSRSR
jgi:hypothetical protein